MKLFGKILVVLILVASVVFMTQAIAVYATHRNWYAAVHAPGGLQDQLDQTRTENQQLKERYRRLQSDLQMETDQRTRQLAKAEWERVRLAELDQQINEQLANLQQNLRTSTADVATAEEQNLQLIDRRDELLAEIRMEQEERNEFFQMAKDATEELQQKLADLVRADERFDQLSRQLGQYLTSADSP